LEKKFLIFLIPALIGVTVLLLRPRSVWLVDGAYEKVWEQVLAASPPPKFTRVMVLPEDGVPPRQHYGFIITTRGPSPAEEPQAASGTESPLTAADAQRLYPTEDPQAADARQPETTVPPPLILYPALAATGEYQGALILALDPWMVFRDFKDPAISRPRIDSAAGGEGRLIVPGREAEAVWAWTAQLLQSSPGLFPRDSAAWQAASERLFLDSRFQQGAATYGWIDALPLFYRSSPAWIYAPLSRIRSLTPQDSGNLEANRFPDRADWHEFGVQADILWAIPFGTTGEQKKLGAAQTWLADPQTQTLLANILGWIPAHREGTPYNAASRAARLAWLSSSFVWQVRP
jgi:hypothetical protein